MYGRTHARTLPYTHTHTHTHTYTHERMKAVREKGGVSGSVIDREREREREIIV